MTKIGYLPVPARHFVCHRFYSPLLPTTMYSLGKGWQVHIRNELYEYSFSVPL